MMQEETTTDRKPTHRVCMYFFFINHATHFYVDDI